MNDNQNEIPPTQQRTVQAHVEATGPGAHTPLQDHADDAQAAEVQQRFVDAPRDAGARQPGEQ